MPTRSVRRLHTQWTPITAGAFTPASLSGLVGWYDASNAASITSSAGRVSQINDLSGVGNHATQSTGAIQPLTGSNTIGGLPTLSFALTYYLTTAISATTTPRFMAAVSQRGENGTALVGSSANDGVEWRLNNDSGTGKMEYLEAGIAHHGFGTSTSNTGADLQHTVQITSGASAFYRSSVADGTNTDAMSFSGAGVIQIGGAATGNYFGGSVTGSWFGGAGDRGRHPPRG